MGARRALRVARGMLKEMLFPIAIIGIISSMLVPLPTGLLDLLLIANIVFAVSLFFAAVYVPEPVRLSVLPSLLLITTLARLSLNISTSRQILASGDAGKTIATFGELMIQGNLVVGLVVFLMISIVQFIVVAKGAERVAEVTARFTLDALPGKQMAIDADLRAGLIDLEGARKRRSELQTESRFFGALDGAMKFVKGDAIAGMLIALVNILGGITAGVALMGLDLAESAHRFVLLSLGDGLVSQIPSLLNSLAAGVIVTRVSTGSTLSSEIFGQLGAIGQSRVLGAAAGILLCLLPGMPWITCLIVAGLILAARPFAATDVAPEQSAEIFKPRTPALLGISIESSMSARLLGTPALVERIERLRGEIFDELGLLLPPPEFRAAHPDEVGSFRVFLRGLPLFHHSGAPDPEDLLAQLTVRLGAWIRAHPCELLDDIMVRRIVDRFDVEAPELSASVVPNALTITQLTEILRGLLGEGVPIRNLDLIFQSIAESAARGGASRALLADVRVGLRRVISTRFRSESSAITCLALDPLTDLRIAACEAKGQPLASEEYEALERGLSARQSGIMALVTTKAARLKVREALLYLGVDLPVLAYSEIDDETRIEIVARIGQSERAEESSREAA